MRREARCHLSQASLEEGAGRIPLAITKKVGSTDHKEDGDGEDEDALVADGLDPGRVARGGEDGRAAVQHDNRKARDDCEKLPVAAARCSCLGHSWVLRRLAFLKVS